ncbi:hypothetical protein ACFE04_024992 [Oxalis oulophora]
MKDVAMIKLFGQSIPISEIDLNRNVTSISSSNICLHEEEDQSLCSTKKDLVTIDKDLSKKEVIENKEEIGNSEDHMAALSGISENPKTDKESSSLTSSKNEELSDNSCEKTQLKKPDKILPCPRCNSKETKFCYYNNYNVNQPRHFCKNCQRYWTSGGTMRNVPVGAGRRKNKNSSTSQYHHLIVSEALRTAQLENNAIVLRFGSDSDSDSPLCESVTSVLTLQSEKSKSFVPNGCHRLDNRDDRSSRSSITCSNSSERIGIAAGLKQSAAINNYQGMSPNIPNFSGSSWIPYPLNSVLHSTMPPPVFSPSGLSMTFFPTIPAHMSYVGPTQCISPGMSSVKRSNPNSPTLGKHSREGNILTPTKEDASKASLLSGLGIKFEKKNSTTTGVCMFDGFQSKGSDKSSADMKSIFLQANPAALSRSVKFHESL